MTSHRSHTKLSLAALAIVATCLFSLAIAATATAAPILRVEISHSPTTMPRNDEQLTYSLKVKNIAGSNPVAGDTLTCDANKGEWFQEPSFSFEWLSNGAPATGAATGPTVTATSVIGTYAVTPADAGHSVQCKVVGSNAGGSAASFSNPTIIAPLPVSPAPPAFGVVNRPTVTGTANTAAARTCSIPTGWSGVAFGTAITTSGSNTLTAVTTATGTGTLTSGSATVTGVTSASGAFLVGQTIAGTGVPAGATILSVGAGTLELSVAATASGSQPLSAGARPFAVGQLVTSANVPAGTTVTAVSAQTVTLSANATATSASPVAVSGDGVGTGTTTSGSNTITGLGQVNLGTFTATTVSGSTGLTAVASATGTGTTASGSKIVTGVSTTTGSFQPGQRITGGGIAATATIAKVLSATELELSANAGAGSGATALSAAGPFVVGQVVTGPGIQPNTTIAAIPAAQTLTLSQAANASASGVTLNTVVPLSFAVGQEISGAGIPAGTTITAVSAGSLEMSANATGSGSAALSAATAGRWGYQWLRNGVPIAGATSAVYVPFAGAGQPDSQKILQCQVAGSNGGGTVVGISNNSNTGVAPFQTGVPLEPTKTPPNNNSENRPFVNFSNSTSGTVTLDFELPAGLNTHVQKFEASGWECKAQEPAGAVHAKASCTRSGQLNPENEYPVAKVVTSLGLDALDPSVAVATVSGGGSVSNSVSDEFHFLPPTPFGVKEFTTKVADPGGSDYNQAGGHPFSASGSLSFNTHIDSRGERAQIEFLRDIKTDTPPGFVGNPQAVPQQCETVEAVILDTFDSPTCPRESIVGSITVDTGATGIVPRLPLYSVKPEGGVPAQFEFAISGDNVEYALTPRLRASDGYAISVDAPQTSKNPVLLAVSFTLCGYGANVQRSPEAIVKGAPQVTGCKQPTDAGANPKPLLTNPTECSETVPVTTVSVDSWDHPGAVNRDGSPDYADPNWRSKAAVSPKVTGCEIVPFSPAIDLQPTSHQADSPTGLDVSLSMPSEGLETAGRIAQGYLKRAVVTLPKGMAVNPAAADGLGACSPAQIGLGTNDPVQCPDSSKVGSAVITTPILNDSLTGNVYIAKQNDNPFKSLLALYLVAESKERGILVKLPGKVVADSVTGQLVASFDNNPQAPIGSVDLHFNSGNRAALLNPPTCGRYEIRSELSPWSAKDPDNPTAAEVATTTSTFEVTSGPGGGPCPDGRLDPKFSAGVQNPVAGSKSPFVLDLSRSDGTRRFKGLDLTLPPGLTAYLKGIPNCSDSALAAVSEAEGTGQGQIDSPSCPSASYIGSVSVGAGGGGNPFYVNTGRAYLAGPYKGAPLSIAIVTPAVAGPFDLGSVVVRAAAYVNPETAQITVKSDPIPTILHGVPLDVRDIRVRIDRPAFTLAPTNCREMAVGAVVAGVDGASVPVSDRFQVGECASLAFKPALKTRLFGGTKRNDNPRFHSMLSAKEGEANIGKVVVALPHSEFLDQSHINTICTRVQFAADGCPKGSIYGYAKAWSPLLDYPVQGPVYLRSSSNPLPDLVAALSGPSYQPIEVDLVGRIDSFKGGIRTTFDAVPDAPVSRFVLDMKGGKKGLLVNSRDLCNGVNRSTVRMNGQNGKVHDFRPVLKSACGKKVKRAVGQKGSR